MARPAARPRPPRAARAARPAHAHQGHLAQHLFFHSLHQEAIPSHATQIFGVASRSEWSTLRRSELSPLQICRLNGLPRGHAQEQAAATLREYAAKGVARQSMPRAVGAGAPPVLASGQSPDPRSNYNPALSADGRWVAFESALGNLNFAKRFRRRVEHARRRHYHPPLRVTAVPGSPG